MPRFACTNSLFTSSGGIEKFSRASAKRDGTLDRRVCPPQKLKITRGVESTASSVCHPFMRHQTHIGHDVGISAGFASPGAFEQCSGHTAAKNHAPQSRDAPTGTPADRGASNKTPATTTRSADSSRRLPASLGSHGRPQRVSLPPSRESPIRNGHRFRRRGHAPLRTRWRSLPHRNTRWIPPWDNSACPLPLIISMLSATT